MTPREYDSSMDPQAPAREGTFDDQLSFPSPITEAPSPIKMIVKRDGREVPFERRKIAEAIFRAAESVGREDWDWSRNMATAVTLYLTKIVDGRAPGVKQVCDAVERVLVEMGHKRAALAYVHYREKRERIRLLRSGDLPLVSPEAVPHFDHDEILQAVTREMDLDEEQAAPIRQEVEKQIQTGGLETLTLALVRELVGAKLMEHGLHDHRQRHVRVGVPLYEAERIVCGLSDGAWGKLYDPEVTDGILAERMKREFALTRVFSQEVADAHTRGYLHLHGLGQIDRLHGVNLPLSRLQRFGMAGSGGAAKNAQELVAQMVGFTAALRRHFSGPLGWDALNFYFAPFVRDFKPEALRDLVRVFLYDFAYPTASSTKQAARTEYSVSWNVPEELRDLEAVGPGGAYTGRTYGDLLHAAQQFAWTLLEEYAEAGDHSKGLRPAGLAVSLSPAFFRSPGHEVFLEHAARAVSSRANLRFDFHREAPFLPHTSDPFLPSSTVAQRVTLNLARAAYRGHNEEGYFEEAERLVQLAALAHLQKKAFIRRLLDLGEAGALGLLAGRGGGGALLDLDKAVFLVGVTGLSECVGYLQGREARSPEKDANLAERILKHLSARCAEWSDAQGLLVASAPTNRASLDQRFAELDLEHFGDAARTVTQSDGPAHTLRYTSGITLDLPADTTPMERLRLESRLHPALDHGAVTVLPVPDPDTSATSIANLVDMAFRQTTCRSIAFE